MSQATSDELAAMSDGALLDAAARDAAAIEERIGRVVIGQRATVRALLAGVLCEGHTLIVGVPGLAKTLLVHTLSDALGWRFRRIQFTPDLMPADIVGMELLDESDGKRAMRFVPGPVFGNLILADEINRCPPKTQAALLEAMQERQVTSMGTTHRLAPPFVVVATQNPIEQEGTYPLPEAQLDRFALGLWMDYPGEEEEVAIASATTGPRGGEGAGGRGGEGEGLAPIASVEVMRAYQALVRRVPASEPVVRYAVKLARATRPGRGNDFADKYVEWGAGPRASQMLVLVGKALAVMDGRASPSMADVREAAAWVLRHRVLPSYEAAAEGVDAAGVVRRVVEAVGEG